jgi:hypothetical protein
MKTRKPPAAWCLLLLLAAGCSTASKPTDKNFLAGLNKYLGDRHECVLDKPLRFPYEVSATAEGAAERQRMDALTDAGLLKREPAQAIKMYVYRPTALGEKVGPSFCFGHREASAIVSSTPVSKRNGFNETDVTYRYEVKDVPVWAKTDGMLKAFPRLRQDISGEQVGTATLAQTGVGWQVPE